MNCTVGNINVSYMEYGFSVFSYGVGTDMQSTETEEDRDLMEGDEGDPRPEDYLYFGLGLPSLGVKGTCTGTVLISAISDPYID